MGTNGVTGPVRDGQGMLTITGLSVNRVRGCMSLLAACPEVSHRLQNPERAQRYRVIGSAKAWICWSGGENVLWSEAGYLFSGEARCGSSLNLPV